MIDGINDEPRGRDLRWRAVFRSPRLGVLVRDGDGRLVECNARFAEMLGTTPQALIGTTAADIMTPAQADIVERDRARLRPLQGASSDPEAERTMTLRDGRQLILRVTACTIPGTSASLPMSVFLVDDLTEQKRLEHEIDLARRHESMARLTAGIAHELNNQLAIVLGFTGVLAKRLGPEDPSQPSLEQIKTAAERSAALTRDLLAFGKQQILAQQPLVISDIIATVVRVQAPTLGPQIELTIENQSDGARVTGDPAKLEQALINLGLNAQDAMPHGGRLTIATAVTARPDQPGTPARWVTISMSDTGSGIPENIQEQIFEPFFTTKEFGQGAGLGLSTALGIIEQSGGTITIRSLPGHGTTAIVQLPALENAPPPAKDPSLDSTTKPQSSPKRTRT
jgi:PAS domain S-box-containing protein